MAKQAIEIRSEDLQQPLRRCIEIRGDEVRAVHIARPMLYLVALPDATGATEAFVVPPIPVPMPVGPANPSSVVPPQYLYHGTRLDNLQGFAANGIEGRSAGWAFMAVDYPTARAFGRYKGGGILVFRVRAQQAWQEGLVFSSMGPYIVAPAVPPGYLDFDWALMDYEQARREGRP